MFEQIQQRAYELYEQRGRADGRDLEDWIQAAREIQESVSPQKRYRHTAENDKQTALIKRMNRCYIRRGCDRKIRIVSGQPQLFHSDGVTPTGRPFPCGGLEGLELAMRPEEK